MMDPVGSLMSSTTSFSGSRSGRVSPAARASSSAAVRSETPPPPPPLPPKLPRADDDDLFVYTMEGAKSTADAFQRIRQAQRACYAAEDPSTSSTSTNDTFLHSFSSDSMSSRDRAAEKAPKRNALPATLEEFRAHPSYAVSLTTDREAVFADALSGFHSLVAREEEELEAFKQQQQLQRRTPRYVHRYQMQGGIACVAPALEGGNGDSGDGPSIPAAYMFLVRSRHEEAARNRNSSHNNTTSSNRRNSEVAHPNSLAALSDTMRLAGDDAASRAKRQELCMQTYLAEKEYNYRRVPAVFRCRSPQPPLREHHHSMPSMAQINRIPKEWMYVWEQFQRDAPREVLLVDDTMYRNPEDAVAAIQSFLEHSYHLGIVAQKQKQSQSVSPSRTGGSVFSLLRDMGSSALKGVALQAQDTLPSFMSTPLLGAVGLDKNALRTAVHYYEDPVKQGEAIYAATREVVLAAQQSFMGFPYQLLCEQVATSQLGLALEAFMQEGVVDIEESLCSSNYTAHTTESIPVAEVAQLPTTGAPPPDTSSNSTSNIASSHSNRSVSAIFPFDSIFGLFDDDDGDEEEDASHHESEVNRAAELLKEEEKKKAKAKAERRRIRQQELRKERAARTLPLLVGEPRQDEFNAFLDIIRRRVEAKDKRDIKKPNDASQSSSTSSLFREDVDGSAYLIPITTIPSAHGDSEDEEDAEQREANAQNALRGMRIRLYYHEQRRSPVVCVNKVFRLFLMPGLFSDEDKAPPTHDDKVKGVSGRSGNVGPEKESVLLLIHIVFGLFSKEEVEVRWQWFNV